MLTEEQLQFLEQLANRYGDVLTDYAWRFFAYRPHQLPAAQDAVQEVFIKAIRHVDKLQHHPNQAAWLKAALKHTLISETRRARRHPEIPSEDVVLQADLNRQNVLSALEKWEQRETLNEVLLTAERILSEGEKQTFRDYFLTGLSTEEAALLEDVTTGTVRGRILRIRQKLRRYFHLSVLLVIAAALFHMGR